MKSSTSSQAQSRSRARLSPVVTLVVAKLRSRPSAANKEFLAKPRSRPIKREWQAFEAEAALPIMEQALDPRI